MVFTSFNLKLSLEKKLILESGSFRLFTFIPYQIPDGSIRSKSFALYI